MTSNLKTLQLVNAAVAVLNAAKSGWSWTPKLLMAGDLMYYPRNNTQTADLPAVFVKPVRTQIGFPTVGGQQVEAEHSFRVVIWDAYSSGDVYLTEKIKRAEDVAQAFIGAAGVPYTLNTEIGGHVIQAFPSSIEWSPPEEELINVDQTFVVAVNVTPVMDWSDRA